MQNKKDNKLRATDDYAFKHLFGLEYCKMIFISLLHAILDGNPVIKDLTIFNTKT